MCTAFKKSTKIMGGFIAALGQQAAGQAVSTGIGAGMGLLLAKSNDRRQIKQQKKLTDIQIAADKQLTDYSYGKQLEMWNATNYAAQVEHLKKAGLNPGLLYGMSGAGGATTGSGGGQSATVGTAPVGGGEVQAMAGMGIQGGMAMAQIELLKSQAELNRVEAKKKAGVDTELGKAQISDLTAGVENKKAQLVLQNIEKEFRELETSMAKDTYKARMKGIEYATNKALQDWTLAAREAEIADNTLGEKILIIEQEALQAVIRTTSMELGNKLTDQQIKESAARIVQKWRELDLTDERNAIEQFKAEVGEMGVIGHVANGVIGNIFDLFKKRRGK